MIHSILLIFLYVQAVAGLAADGRQIVARAKSEATSFERFASCILSENMCVGTCILMCGFHLYMSPIV